MASSLKRPKNSSKANSPPSDRCSKTRSTPVRQVPYQPCWQDVGTSTPLAWSASSTVCVAPTRMTAPVLLMTTSKGRSPCAGESVPSKLLMSGSVMGSNELHFAFHARGKREECGYIGNEPPLIRQRWPLTCRRLQILGNALADLLHQVLPSRCGRKFCSLAVLDATRKRANFGIMVGVAEKHHRETTCSGTGV